MGMMDEDAAKDLLGRYGIDRPPHAVIRADELGRLDVERLRALGVGYPVVVKVLGDDLAHKTEGRAVVVCVRDAEELMDAIRDLVARFPRRDLLVERYVPHGPELLLGLSEDRTFGRVVAFGAGGTLTEVYGDVAFRPLPLSGPEMGGLLSSTRMGRVLAGYRGMEPQVDAVLRAMAGMARLADERPDVLELEVNPLVVVGGRPVALDAKVVVGDQDRSVAALGQGEGARVLPARARPVPEKAI